MCVVKNLDSPKTGLALAIGPRAVTSKLLKSMPGKVSVFTWGLGTTQTVSQRDWGGFWIHSSGFVGLETTDHKNWIPGMS